MLVESLDRLSREKVGEAIERLKLILNHGIDVITLCDNTVYNIDSLNEPYSLIKAILIAQRANEESEIKSSRVKLSWKKKTAGCTGIRYDYDGVLSEMALLR